MHKLIYRSRDKSIINFLLFNQLGLDGADEAIKEFIDNNAPIGTKIKLHEADFWTVSQSLCFEEMIDEDADWAEIADQLSVLLR